MSTATATRRNGRPTPKPTPKSVRAAKPKGPILLVTSAFNAAHKLYAAGALAGAIPYERDAFDRKDIAALENKGVVRKTGATPGRFGKPGMIQLLVDGDDIREIPNRAPRKGKADTVATPRTARTAPARLSFAALKAFTAELDAAVASESEARMISIEDGLAHLQAHLAIAKGDDFRNTIAMVNARLKEQDDVTAAVMDEVLERLKPDAGLPTFAIWSALKR
jgi:hypothetical protein